ncbi:MAG: 50S ribosomal protein L3 N(5)-glutamine methyltransferase [Aestuariivirga sp.]|uniref:50S ribosomal protein L3 N(5)-glutamine methyltransferase n=1 Tax=Aestuariivirga sp. TaxID=2650926 RepID=UPI0025B8FC20|nr:50S ribosomal protein L3 N(5)-glutamine methyltransferase [Aestuariivirga sp.]MCA3559987.1 50S ribosomal protein L3 N(5)-glutamine methyltransferase [Aestuariivirga sp.]
MPEQQTAGAAASQLSTVRDFLRWALSEFRAAKLVHGHGTTSATNEAAFLILEALHLPVDDINPWLDARLLEAEKQKLAALIRARIDTRLPAAYLVKRAYIQGVPFYVDERVIVPRSYIGELMFSGVFGGGEASLIEDAAAVTSVLDLCTGSGCLAILAAGIFRDAEVDAADLSADALEVARINIDEHDVADRVSLLQGDLFDAVEGRSYDIIIANPPYVAGGEVAAFPPEYGHEPVMAHLGGEDGLDIVRRILGEAADHLNPGGGLLCEIGTGRERLVDNYPQLDFLWLDTEESEGEVFWITREQLLEAAL